MLERLGVQLPEGTICIPLAAYFPKEGQKLLLLRPLWRSSIVNAFYAVIEVGRNHEGLPRIVRYLEFVALPACRFSVPELPTVGKRVETRRNLS
jgi:hypothetical protein